MDWDAARIGLRRADAGRGRATGCPGVGDDAEVLHVVTPGRLGAARAWWRAPRSRSRTPSPRPARSGRPTPCAASTTSCWPDRPPCRGSGVPTAIMSGRLAADRITGSARSPLELGGRTTHDQIGARRRRGARPGTARGLPAVPRRSTPARQDVLPGHPAAGARAAAGGARAVRVRPASPTTSSTSSTGTATIEQRAEQLQELSTQLFNSLVDRTSPATTIRS